MGGPRTKLLLSILAILLVAFATADTLRLPQRRALKNKEEEEMLFTEGRKGGKASKIKGEKGSSNNSEDSWRSGDGADQWRSGDTTSGGKEKESTYDRPPMKIKGEKGSRKSEESVEEPTKKSTEKEAEEPKKGDEKGVEEKWSSVDPVTKEPKGAKSKGEAKKGPDGRTGETKTTQKESNPEPAPAPTPTPTLVEPDIEIPATSPTSIGVSRAGFVLSQFGLEFTLGDSARIPLTMDFAELESATIGYLEEYLELTYNADDTILFESVEIEATARRTGGSEGTPFVDFEASVAFMENSPNIPSSEEIGQTISEALSGRNLATYLFTLAQRLSAGSPFLTTTLVTVYMPDAVMTGSGRVVTQSSGMSAAAIIGAASAGAVTLAIAGFVLFKAKKENSDNMSKFMKGYPGGMTVAGDTCATSTLGPTAVRPDDHHSIGTSVYTDDQSYISSFRRKNDGDDIMLNTNGRRPSAKKLPSEAVSFDRASIQHHDIEAGESYVSPPSHPRKMVNALKKASPLNNTDLKNYFKSKYKCSSPGGYSPVVENNEDRKSKSSHETSKSQDNSTGLDLPALDHESVTEEKPQKGQGRRKNRQYQPLQSDSNDNEEDEYYLEDSDEDNISSMGVDDLVRVSQSKLGTVEKGNAVPHLPDERTPSDELTEANASTENSLDEVSLH